MSTFDIYLLIVNYFERLHTRNKKFRSSSETEPTFCDGKFQLCFTTISAREEGGSGSNPVEEGTQGTIEDRRCLTNSPSWLITILVANR